MNTNDISRISIKPNKYCIHFESKQFDGLVLSIASIGWGHISSHTSEIEICKTAHPDDYKTVSDWIDKIE